MAGGTGVQMVSGTRGRGQCRRDRAVDRAPGVVRRLGSAAAQPGHLLPDAWLQRIGLGRVAFPYVLVWMTACYWIAAPLVYRNALGSSRARTTRRAAHT